MDTAIAPCNDPSEHLVLKGTLERLSQCCAEVRSVLFVFGALRVTTVDSRQSLVSLIEVSDASLYRFSGPGKFSLHPSSTTVRLRNVLAMDLNLIGSSRTLEFMQKCKLMGKHDDLAFLRHTRKRPRDVATALMVDRAHGVVQDNRLALVRHRDLGQEECERKAALLALTEHLPK